MKVFDFKDRAFWKLLINIGLPIAIQNLIFNSLTLVDNILIGGLGEVNIAAVGIANKLSFVFMLFMFGINSGANIFSSQFHGKQDLRGVRKVLGLSLFSGIISAIPFTLLGLLAPAAIIDLFTDDPEVIKQGVLFLRIMALSYPINAITASYGMQSRGVGRTKVPLVSSAIALSINTVLGYLLIYGKFGLPVMGIQGAAVATLIARVVECIILLTLIYKNKYELAAKLSEFSGYTREFLVKFIRPVLPVILNEVIWAIGVSGYTIFYGKLGTEAVATVQILDVINGMFFSLFIGIGNACGAIIGNKIGAGEEETARVYARRFVMVGAAFGLTLGVLFFMTAPLFLGLFDITAATLAICKSTVIVYACYMTIKVINMIMIVGVCRGGGDTLFAMTLDICAPWLIGLPLAALSVLVLGFPVFLTMAVINIEELVKTAFSLQRLFSDKWLRNLVKDIHHEESVAVLER